MTDNTTEKPVPARNFQKASEQQFASYEEARAVFDKLAVSPKQKKRLRRRKDGFAVVAYDPVPAKKE